MAPAERPDEPVHKTGGSGARRPPRTGEVTRSDEVRRSPATRQQPGKASGAAKNPTRAATPRARSAGNGSSARKPSKATTSKPSSGNGTTGEQQIVKPDRAETIVGPTWAETIATLATPDELNPDDIAILTGWTQVAAAPADSVAEPQPLEHEPLLGAPVTAENAALVAPPLIEPPLVEPPLVEPPLVEPVVAPALVTEPETTSVIANPVRAFTLWRRRRPRVRKVTRVVRRIDAWSVLKVSVLFYLVLFVILLVAGVLLWNLAMSTGTVRNVEGFIRDLFNLEKFDVSGRDLFRASWTLGLFLVVAGTGLNVTMAVLFNLISDLVGGVRVTVLEEEVVLRPRAVNVSGRPAPPGAGQVVEEPAPEIVADGAAPTIDGVS